MGTRAKKTSKAAKHPKTGEPPALSGEPNVGGPSLDSYPNWNPTRRTLALDAYDPGADYIRAAAPDSAQRLPDAFENASELDQRTAELIAEIDAKPSPDGLPTTRPNQRQPHSSAERPRSGRASPAR